ncbi:MAG: hypothetical protein QW404_00160 [Candidatus Nanoarchaeia archaeon]
MVLESIDFEGIISDLESAGFYEVVLPFFLIFTIIFGILEKTNIFGKDSHKFNIVIALVAGFLMVRSTTLVSLMNRFLPNVSMFVLVIVAFLIVLGIFGIQSDKWGGGLLFVFFIIAIVGVVWGLGQAAEEEGIEWLPDWLDITQEDIEIIAGLAALLVVIWFLVAKKKSEQEYRFFKGFKDIGDALRGGQG